MSDFIKFRNAVQHNFNELAKSGTLYFSNVSKDEMWTTYLESFPAGTNELFRERLEHECNCCKHALNVIARVFGEKDGVRVSIWENINTGTFYDVVAQKMHEKIKDSKIAGIFLHGEPSVGKDHNFEIDTDGKTIRWDHFHQVIPVQSYIKIDLAKLKGSAQTDKSVLERSLTEITPDSLETVLDLITQNSIYRGQEHEGTVKFIMRLQDEYNNAKDKDLYLWKTAFDIKGRSNLRGTVIGSLLVDLSAGEDLESAVKSFESKVAPHNYKRSSALVTPKMIEEAKAKAKELGIEPSTLRRHATKADINVSDILYADGTVKPFMADSVFDVIQPTKGNTVNVESFSAVQEMGIEEFISTVLPKAQGIEMMFENRHASNLMSVIAPVNSNAPNIMKWNNNFSWTYNGDITDSDIRTRVKAAGGVVDAPFRISLSWEHRDDLDLHLYRSDRIGVRDHVYFGSKVGAGARLDVDMRGEQFSQVENIFWQDLSKMPAGEYSAVVRNYMSRSSNSTDPARVEGFELEVDYKGAVQNISTQFKLRDSDEIQVLAFSVDTNGKVTFKDLNDSRIVSTARSQNVWGIESSKFHKVNMVMLSPNHWNGQSTGNKHYFFIIDNCKNEDTATGFYNEFLIDDLKPHRKVFEMLSRSMRVQPQNDQLSGFGFSSTQSNSVLVKVQGDKNRTIKVLF